MDLPAFSGSNTILEGITIRGGSSEVVRYRGSGTIKNCTIEAESGDASTGILVSGYGEIRDCTVTMALGGTDIGVDVSGAGTDVVDCAATVSANPTVRNCSVTSIGASGIGFNMASGNPVQYRIAPGKVVSKCAGRVRIWV